MSLMLGVLTSRAGRIGLALAAVLVVAVLIYGRGYAAGENASQVEALEAQLAAAQRDRDVAAEAEAQARAIIIGLEETARYNREALDALQDDLAGTDACLADGAAIGRLLDLR